MAATFSPTRLGAVRAGVRVETVTLAWMVVEATVAIGAGIAARSVLLTAFGLDSVIELISGGVMLWRLQVEARGANTERLAVVENRAAWVTGVALSLLCAYVAVLAALALVTRTKPEVSPVGIALATVAVVGMPFLAVAKRRIAGQIGSAALRGDAACSATCASMAVTLLVGLALNALLGWWWAESVAAFALLYWLGHEAREALTGARAGRGGCACGDAPCDVASAGQ